jgi:hypothetical protein
MGCFSVSCGISGISMFSDEACLIPLVPIYKGYQPSLDVTFICENEGVRSFFKPLTLPIFGNLNGYGSLENIERDANVECIEEYFECSIKEFLEALEMFRDSDNKPFPQKLIDKKAGGMFVNREIYKHLSENIPSEKFFADYNYYSVLWQYNYNFRIETIRLIGFEKVRDDGNNVICESNRWPGVVIVLKERANQIIYKDNSYNLPYTLHKIILLLEKLTGVGLSSEEMLELEKVNKYSVEVDIYKRLLEKIRSPLDVLDNLDIYEKRIDDVKNNFCDFLTVLENMSASNRLLMPTWCGYQMGNDSGHLYMLEKTLEILKRRENEDEFSNG